MRGLLIAALVLIHCREKVTRILLAQADEVQEVGGAYEGNIAVVMGLKHVRACNLPTAVAAVLYLVCILTAPDPDRRHAGAVCCCGQGSVGGGGCGFPAGSTHNRPSCLLLHCGAHLCSQPEKCVACLSTLQPTGLQHALQFVCLLQAWSMLCSAWRRKTRASESLWTRTLARCTAAIPTLSPRQPALFILAAIRVYK